jgi:hypothetical protein
MAQLRLVLAVFVIGLLTASCGSTVVGEPERASGQEGLFNPCTDIPDSVIEEVGVDLATVSIDIFGVEQPGWKICSWDGSWYNVTIYSTSYTVSDVRSNPDYVDFIDIVIGDRSVTQYRRADRADEGCYVIFAVGQGSVWINAERDVFSERKEDSCSETRRLADELGSYLPH